jgi:hypothetical protein
MLTVAVACSYPLLYLGGSAVSPVWLLFRDWGPLPRPVLVAQLVDPLPFSLAPERARVQTLPQVKHGRPGPGASNAPNKSLAASTPKPSIEAPKESKELAAPVTPRFDEKAASYAAQAKNGPLPHFVIDTEYASYVPVMRRFSVELAMGASKPTPYTITFLYSVGTGHLRRDRPPANSVPRRIQEPLNTAVAWAVRSVADQLGVLPDSIEVYAMYPLELYLALAGKVREAMEASGVPDGCATVSYLPRGSGFDVEVRPTQPCNERKDNPTTLR